ncbi:ABC transporter permease [Methylomarinum vadi]|uniref:ABC transporter permease n=1 Tax=Methylomarinum vadi TaxID=438855 RepID=UPI0004DF0A44|nr:ABC transporter permease [Methylomarinum vadi]
MNNIQTIPLQNLALTFVPVLVVLVILFKWQQGLGHASYALARMLTQLLLIGYLLNYIFKSDSPAVTLSILAVMILFSCWIGLGSIKSKRRKLLLKAIIAVLAGGGATLGIIILTVLELQPWYQARYVIPLAGMIFASCMNSLSLAADRFQAEMANGAAYVEARNHAFHTAMIPTINGLLAVGLVSLPGMMTGQILSGVSPFIAARYQIMVMAMIFASSGLTATCFLSLLRKDYSHQ